jgi:hypothetical protein
MKHFLLFFTAIASLYIVTGCSKKQIYSTGLKYQTDTEPPTYSDIEYSRPLSYDPYAIKRRTVEEMQAKHRTVNRNFPAEKLKKIDREIEKFKQELETQTDQKDPAAPQILSGTEKTKAQIKPARMITYDGFIACRSIKPDSLISRAVALAESLKGYVEERNGQSVTLRIPVPKFEIIYDSLLKLGEVTNYRRSAEDITDAFRDTDLRMTVLEKTIERYVKLISLVKEEKEKIALLKEIERLRVELESLQVRKSVLALRADFAMIVYTVQQVTTGFAGVQETGQVKGLEWISGLDPVTPYRLGRKLKLEIPDGMVRLEKRNYWITQSPAGSRVWTARIQNEPAGTSDFWINTLGFQLQDRFLTVDTSTVSGYRFLRCTPQPGVNYRYNVGIRVVKKEVYILQCFFPDEIQEKRYFDTIKKILASDGGAS